MQHLVFVVILFASLFIASSVYATGVCIRGYGNTPEEAFKVGTTLLNKKAAELGKGSLTVDLQIRILPDKKKDFFTVLVYSMDKPTSCDLPSKAAKEKKTNCTENICTI